MAYHGKVTSRPLRDESLAYWAGNLDQQKCWLRVRGIKIGWIVEE